MSSTPEISRTCRCVNRVVRFLRPRGERPRAAEARRAPFDEGREERDVVRRMLRALSRNRFYTGALLRSAASSRHTLPVAIDPFTLAESRYKSLIDHRRAGGLQPRAFRLAVRDLAVLDSEGRRWMLGPEDGIWYRRENERWLQADPPRRLVCSSCGHHNLGRHSFCVECGRRLNRND